MHTITEPEIESEIRHHRRRMFDLSEGEQEKAGDRIGTLKLELEKVRASDPKPTGPYSGLTRGELAQSCTCEPDWY